MPAVVVVPVLATAFFASCRGRVLRLHAIVGRWRRIVFVAADHQPYGSERERKTCLHPILLRVVTSGAFFRRKL
jgi:hypothetical protein